MTRTETTTTDTNGKKVTEIVEETDDGRGNVTRKQLSQSDTSGKKALKK